MLKKIFNKFIIILITVFSIFSLMAPIASASSLGDIITSADDFLEVGDSGSVKLGNDTIKDMSNLIYNILLVIGIVIAVIIGLVIGIQFMTGSASEKAKVKETLVPYIAGCIVLFGAFGIWKLVVTILQSNS